jgi:hypothetical protein
MLENRQKHEELGAQIRHERESDPNAGYGPRHWAVLFVSRRLIPFWRLSYAPYLRLGEYDHWVKRARTAAAQAT